MVADPDLARDVDACCRLTGEFTLRSGQVASEYFDKYLFEADPALLARVVEQMVDLVPDGTELLGGLELGGVPIATVLSARTGLPALFVRKQAKEYGTCKLAEGPDVAGRRVTLVEDVITTGGAVRDATRALREAGAIVETVVCAIDRSPEGREPAGRRRARGTPGAHQGRARRRARLGSRGLLAASRRPAASASCPGRLTAVLVPLVDDRDHREGEDDEDRLVDVLAQRRERPAEEVAEQGDAQRPTARRRRRSRGRTGGGASA